MRNVYRLAVLFLFLIVGAGIAFAQVPAAPENLTVTAQHDAGVVLHWDAADGAAFYKIYKSVDGSPFGPIGATEHLSFIDWFVSRNHEYRYYVRGAHNDVTGPSSDTVEFHFVSPPPEGAHGLVTGSITDDSTGLPIREANVRFFGRDGLWRVNVHTDSTGVYRAVLDTGRYLIRAERFSYVPEWFDNALELSAATVVHVHEDTTTANFGLRPVPVSVPITLSGIVRDSTDGQPLANALVVYMRPFGEQRLLDRELELFGGFDWERLQIPGFGWLHGVVWFGLTDSSGSYEAHVRSNQRYIAMAFKPGYVHKFYHNKFTPFHADRISESGDMSGFDFDLMPNPLASLFLSGTVHDTTNAGVLSHVVLVRLTAVGPRIVRYRSTDSLGNYSFGNLVPGIFMVKAVPVDFFAPSWYASGDCGVRNWHNADTIHLTGNRTGADVCVVPTRDGGCGRISGTVAGNGNIDAGNLIKGATVYAVSDATNQVVGYDVTEDDGSYSILNLAPGTYSIVVDQEGYSPLNVPSVTIGSSNNFEANNASVTINQDVVTSAPEQNKLLPAQYRLDQNYPNPFNPSTTIGFALPKASVVSLRIYNIIGQEVTTLVNATLDAGSHQVKWNGTDNQGKPVGSGMYFAKLSATSSDGNVNFVQTRKVLLMK